MLRLSFSTLGCPEWDIAQIVAAATAGGYAAVDFRGYLGTTDITESDAFKGASLREIARRVAGEGISVSCLSSSAKMSAADDADRMRTIEAVRRYADLCNALGCRQIRIFGGRRAGTPDPLANAAETLARLSEVAVAANVEVLVETHDDWTSSPLLAKAIDRAGRPAGIGVLWDVHHPYRFHGERPADTLKSFGGLLRNTHWKDSRRLADGSFALCLCGDGDVPLKETFDTLAAAGYAGWHTFEWEKKWHPELDDPSVAIPHFATFMRNLANAGKETR